MSRFQFLIEKHCPYCACRLNASEMYDLHPHHLTKCSNCEGFYRNSHLRTFLSTMLPVAFFMILAYLFTAEWWMFMILLPVAMLSSMMLFAKPIEAEPPDKKVSRHFFRARRGK